MTEPAGSAPGNGHAARRKPRKSKLVAPARGDLRVALVEGSALAPEDQEKPITAAQSFRITLLFAADVKRHRNKKTVTKAPYEHVFKNVPAGKYIVVVENVSDVPSHPGAIAEVRVKPAVKTPPAKPPPTNVKLRLATDTIGSLANACGFRIGAREQVPQRQDGARIGDLYPQHFNARVLTAFWKTSNVQSVPASSMAPGQSFVVLSKGADETPLLRSSIDGIPPDPGFGAPSLTVAFPVNPPSVVPMNLFFVRDAASGAPLLSGGKEIYGLLQAEQGWPGHDVPYDAQNRLQITFVRRVAAGDDYTLEVAPAGDIPPLGIRYFRYHPGLQTAQYTPLVWYNLGNGAPPTAAQAALKGKALMDAIDGYVKDMLLVRQHLPDRQRQYIVVNEPLIPSIGTTTLRAKLPGKVASKTLRQKQADKRHKALADKLIAAAKKSARAFHTLLRKTHLPAALYSAWLVQNKGSHWLNKTAHKNGERIEYIVRAFAAAAPADPGAMLILNEHTCESIDIGKGLALAVLTRVLKQRLAKAKAPMKAAQRVAVGFQMHLGDKYYDTRKKKDNRQKFLHGLVKTMDYYTRFAHTRVFVTEMGIRPPGLASADRRKARLDHTWALFQLLQVVQAPGFFPPGPAPVANQPPPVLTQTDPVLKLVTHKTTPAGDRIELVLAVEVAAEDKNADDVPEKLAIVIEKGALFIGMDRVGATTGEIQAWIEKKKAAKAHETENARRAKAIFDELSKDQGQRFTNTGAWSEYAPGLDAIAKAVVTTPRQRREQADFFYKVARICLSRQLCDDLNFWGLTDSLHNDTYDWRGFLFSESSDAGTKPPAPPDFPYYRKAAYFGVVQALIEAAIAKNRPAIRPYAMAHRRSSTTGGDHLYEEHLFPPV
jgi:hypothetical protein